MTEQQNRLGSNVIGIKFAHNCDPRHTSVVANQFYNRDPLRDEYLILTTIKDLNIAPQAVSLSSTIVPSAIQCETDDFRINSMALRKVQPCAAKCKG